MNNNAQQPIAARAPADSVTAPAGGVAHVAIKMVGYGGCTGINDYLMSDGSIKTMRPHEVIWRDAAQQAAPTEPMANDIHGALTAAAIYLTNAQRQYGKEMHRQAIASLEKAQRSIAQAAGFAKTAPTPPTQAQAGAVPLTVEQIKEICRQHIVRDKSKDEPNTGAWPGSVALARAIERAHGIGIKGGQHGPA